MIFINDNYLYRPISINFYKFEKVDLSENGIKCKYFPTIGHISFWILLS